MFRAGVGTGEFGGTDGFRRFFARSGTRAGGAVSDPIEFTLKPYAAMLRIHAREGREGAGIRVMGSASRRQPKRSVIQLRSVTRDVCAERDPAEEGLTPAHPDSVGSHASRPGSSPSADGSGRRLLAAVLLPRGRFEVEAAILRGDILDGIERVVPPEFFESAPFERIVVLLRGDLADRPSPAPPLLLLDRDWLEVSVPISHAFLRAADDADRLEHVERSLLETLVLVAARFGLPSAELRCARHIAGFAAA